MLQDNQIFHQGTFEHQTSLLDKVIGSGDDSHSRERVAGVIKLNFKNSIDSVLFLNTCAQTDVTSFLFQRFY